MTEPEPATVDLWVDPLCPFAWMTSRWLREVERERAVSVVFHVMSLAVLNEDQDVPEKYRRHVEKGWAMGRLLAAADSEGGPDALGRLYDALGTRLHPGGEKPSDDLNRAALADAGLPASLLEAADDAGRWDGAVRESHRAGLEPLGGDGGSPVLHVAGPEGRRVPFFGPVLVPAPKGEAAGRLWDGLSAVFGTDGFYELRRSRDRDPDFS